MRGLQCAAWCRYSFSLRLKFVMNVTIACDPQHNQDSSRANGAGRQGRIPALESSMAIFQITCFFCGRRFFRSRRSHPSNPQALIRSDSTGDAGRIHGADF
jgi:hypothetical protein